MLAAPLASAQDGSVRQAAPAVWRRFELTTRVRLAPADGPSELWLPLVATAGDYQTSLDPTWRSNGAARIVHDRRYGARVLKVEWVPEAADGAGQPKTIYIVQVVMTRDRTASDSRVPATAAERQFWQQPTESIPTDGIVYDTAQRIVAGRTTPRDRLLALYDWIVTETLRNPNTRGCGTGDVRTMLRSGNLSGKCADINGLMTALARAAGFPARDVYGIRVAASRYQPCLGAAGDVTKAQHCRSEVYLDAAGWFPVDPADVRKLMLERRLTLDDPQVAAARARLFGSWEMNWVGYNSATDIVLPGLAPGHVPNFPFLMYPCAFTGLGQLDCLDPASFSYQIETRELTV